MQIRESSARALPSQPRFFFLPDSIRPSGEKAGPPAADVMGLDGSRV